MFSLHCTSVQCLKLWRFHMQMQIKSFFFKNERAQSASTWQVHLQPGWLMPRSGCVFSVGLSVPAPPFSAPLAHFTHFWSLPGFSTHLHLRPLQFQCFTILGTCHSEGPPLAGDVGFMLGKPSSYNFPLLIFFLCWERESRGGWGKGCLLGLP